MEDKRNEMMYITTYADDTGLFSERECNFDNTAGFEVPRWIIEDWYKQNEKVNKEETMDELKISEEEATFDRWINEVYIHDDFIGFYNFCIIKGFVPNILNPDEEVEDKVYYEDDEGNKQIVFEGTYDECRRWCRYYNWSYRGFELQLEIE